MNVELKPELERRLQSIAEKRSQSLSDLVEEAMLSSSVPSKVSLRPG